MLNYPPFPKARCLETNILTVDSTPFLNLAVCASLSRLTLSKHFFTNNHSWTNIIWSQQNVIIRVIVTSNIVDNAHLYGSVLVTSWVSTSDYLMIDTFFLQIFAINKICCFVFVAPALVQEISSLFSGSFLSSSWHIRIAQCLYLQSLLLCLQFPMLYSAASPWS